MQFIKCFILAIAFLYEGAFLFDQKISDAVQAGNLDLVKVLVERNPQLINEKDSRYRTPLHTAVAFDHKEIVKYLLEKGRPSTPRTTSAELRSPMWPGNPETWKSRNSSLKKGPTSTR